ncbi:MAG: PmeII family type II restriction endonuclease [Candidatus Shapirobacteria bacterium]
MISEKQKSEFLLRLGKWVTDDFAKKYENNIRKCSKLSEFKVNPLLLPFLSLTFTGNVDPESLAKVLVYPRVLSTSITTTFGTGLQRFITDAWNEICGGSGLSGIDIEFTDQIEGGKKYAQIKLGPNTINKDDVKTITDHFKGALNLSRTNNLKIKHEDLVVGVVYGKESEKNANLKKLDTEYTVLIGQDFWYHLTGDKDFYNEMKKTIFTSSEKICLKDDIEKAIKELSKSINKDRILSA